MTFPADDELRTFLDPRLDVTPARACTANVLANGPR